MSQLFHIYISSAIKSCQFYNYENEGYDWDVEMNLKGTIKKCWVFPGQPKVDWSGQFHMI